MVSQCNKSHSRVDPASHVNYKFLTSAELKERLRSLHANVRSTTRKVDRLKKKLSEVIEQHGCQLDAESDCDMREIMKVNSQSIAEKYRRVFWEQQMKAASQNDARQMRWHPAMIKWCLYLRHRSSGAYETLRKTGCIYLPSQRTLRDYTHVAGSRMGFSKEVDMRC